MKKMNTIEKLEYTKSSLMNFFKKYQRHNSMWKEYALP